MAYSNYYGRFYALGQQVRSALSDVWNFYPARWYFLAGAVLQLFAWFEAFFIYRNLSGDLLVLHYNVDFGIDLVGSPARIFAYPVVSLGVFALNLFAAAAWHRQKGFPAFVHFLLSAALVFGLFMNLALLFVYLINFR